MTYDILYRLACDAPGGCTNTWSAVIPTGDESTPTVTAERAGWEVGTEEGEPDLCPGHARATTGPLPVPVPGPELPAYVVEAAGALYSAPPPVAEDDTDEEPDFQFETAEPPLAPAPRPETMMQPVTFDDDDEDEPELPRRSRWLTHRRRGRGAHAAR